MLRAVIRELERQMPGIRALVFNGFESSGREVALERLWDCKERDTKPPNSVVLPFKGGGASSWVQVQLGCALVGHARDRGTVPSQQDAQEYVGFLQPISAGGWHFVSPFQSKTGKDIREVRGGKDCYSCRAQLYSSTTNSRATWNSSHSPGNTWSASARETL